MPSAAHSSTLTRRDLLQVGSVGTLGLSLPSLLIADSAADKDTGGRRSEKFAGANLERESVGAISSLRWNAQSMKQRGREVFGKDGVVFDVGRLIVGRPVHHSILHAAPGQHRRVGVRPMISPAIVDFRCAAELFSREFVLLATTSAMAKNLRAI